MHRAIISNVLLICREENCHASLLIDDGYGEYLIYNTEDGRYWTYVVFRELDIEIGATVDNTVVVSYADPQFFEKVRPAIGGTFVQRQDKAR